MAKERKLGQGLSAIFGTDADGLLETIDEIQRNPKQYGGTQELNVDDIQVNPYQPRKQFNEEALQELADSITEHGIITPVLVKKTDFGYVLIAGERRLRASKMAGKTTIPAIVRDFTDEQMMEISLLENIQREDLSAIEEAMSYETLIQRLGYTQEQLAKRVGKSREHVTNQMRLLKLPKEVQQMVSDKVLTMGQVRPLITLEDDEKVIEIANQIQKEGLSVRKVEQMVKEVKNPTVKKPTVKKSDPDLENVQSILTKRLGTTVKISNGEIKIKYNGIEDLNRILEVMDCLDD
ncbi:MAG: ParB/RepB/Spo0J family partition protein [Erysipelotrichaceae bacterium]|nr:ParB/RepB/Spo0J family partition protein [Erysipelotrichaceae bacterium]